MSVTRTVLDLFRIHAKQRPLSPAVIDGDRPVGYAQLDRDSDTIAAHLIRRGIGPGDIVPLICERSTGLIAGLLGIVKSGAAYVPIDDGYPDARKRYLVERTGSGLVLCSPGAWADGNLEVLDIDRLVGEPMPGLERDPTASDAAYVVFTSGTSGLPKGVVVEHAALENLIAWHNREFAVDSDSRVPLMAKIGFDVSQWEIWSTLCAGASLYLLDRAVRVDADALVQFYARNSITHAFVPTVMVPDVVSAARGGATELRYLFCAGEKLNPVDLDGLGCPLVDYYGPTEATIFATARRVPSARLGMPYSIGTPVAGASVRILDEALSPVAPGEIGELCIGGPGLARGYLDNDALTRERFVSVGGQRLYRSGDMARELPDGDIQFLGRRDEQIKIRGNRVELGEIEAALQVLPGVRQAAVAATAPDDPGRKQIVAFLTLEPSDEIHGEALQSALHAQLSKTLPDYMIPSDFVEVDGFALTPNGKIDKIALLDGWTKRRPSGTAMTDCTRPQAQIAASFARLLGHSDFGLDDSFFALGGQSLLAARLIKDIAETRQAKAYVRDIYDFPSVRTLAAELERRCGRAIPASDAEPARALQADVHLIEGTQFAPGYVASQLTAPRHVLLTGATGFVGAHLLCELLASTAATIHCPVRAPDDRAAGERLRSVLAKYLLEPDGDSLLRVRAYPADLAEPRLGLGAYDHDYLSEAVDVVYHSASAVNFIQPYSYMRRDNVQGLREIIAFCARCRTEPLALLSTISVYSWGHLHTGKQVMREDDDIDQNLPAVTTDIGYVRSKWVMEKIADLAATLGLPLMTFRLGYATFNRRTGCCADYQWWSRLVRTCLSHGTLPELHDLREGLTTVDYMTRAIAHISRNPEALGKKFNLIHSDGNNLTLLEFFEKLEAATGRRLHRLSYRDWRAQWENDPDAPLYPLLSLFKDSLYDGLSTVELYQNTYRWDCSNVHEFLRGSDIAEPCFNEEELLRYVRRSIGQVSIESFAPSHFESPRLL